MNTLVLILTDQLSIVPTIQLRLKTARTDKQIVCFGQSRNHISIAFLFKGALVPCDVFNKESNLTRLYKKDEKIFLRRRETSTIPYNDFKKKPPSHIKHSWRYRHSFVLTPPHSLMQLHPAVCSPRLWTWVLALMFPVTCKYKLCESGHDLEITLKVRIFRWTKKSLRLESSIRLVNNINWPVKIKDDFIYDEFVANFYITRRLKSFPWDALVYGSIMAFYLNLEKLGKPERCVMLWASMNRLPVWVGLMCLWLNL